MNREVRKGAELEKRLRLEVEEDEQRETARHQIRPDAGRGKLDVLIFLLIQFVTFTLCHHPCPFSQLQLLKLCSDSPCP